MHYNSFSVNRVVESSREHAEIETTLSNDYESTAFLRIRQVRLFHKIEQCEKDDYFRALIEFD